MIKTLTFLLACASFSHAAITIDLPGNQETSGWNQLTHANPFWTTNGYTTSYPGATLWPGSIAANMSGSTGSAVFSKLAGNGYFASASIYDGGGAGTYSVSDATPLSNLATVVFQLDVGTDIGITPVLNFNGGAQALAPDFSTQVAGNYLTLDFGTGSMSPTENHAWQWDLTGLGVTSYEVVWGSLPNNHLTQYELNLSTSDSFTQVVPEPSALLLSLGGLLLTLRRRRS